MRAGPALSRWRSGTIVSHGMQGAVSSRRPELVWAEGEDSEEAAAGRPPRAPTTEPRPWGQAEADAVTDSNKDGAAAVPLITTAPRGLASRG